MMMSLDKSAWIAAGSLLIASIVAGSILSKKINSTNPFTDRGLLQKGASLPPLWLFYDEDDVNDRGWADFGARSSHALNVPYLNLAYEAIVRHNSDNYRIEVINGVTGLAELLGWDAIPATIKSRQRIMTAREANWARAAILARFGGLWLESSSLCVRGFGPLPANKIIFFGTDLDEAVVGAGGTRIPGMRAIWAGKAGNPVFNAWAANAAGSATDEKTSYLMYAEGADDVIVNVEGECGRGPAQKRIEIDELLGTSDDGRLPFAVSSGAVFVPMPWKELILRRSLEWFLTMTEKDIMESDLVVRWLLEA